VCLLLDRPPPFSYIQSNQKRVLIFTHSSCTREAAKIFLCEALWKKDELLKQAMSRTPMARPAEPEEMVGAIIFLASDASSYVTGQVIAAGGGVTI